MLGGLKYVLSALGLNATSNTATTITPTNRNTSTKNATNFSRLTEMRPKKFVNGYKKKSKEQETLVDHMLLAQCNQELDSGTGMWV